MESWVGYSSEDLISTWGAPDSVMELDNGKKVLTWITYWNYQQYVYTCRRTFTTDSYGVVEKWSYNGCPAF